MAKQLIIDVTAGTQTYVDLTPEEEAERVRREAEHAESARAEAERLALLAKYRPDAATIAAITAGDPLAPAALESAVRWLVLRAVEG